MGTSDRRIVLLGIGGASCSGKTTLARHILRILPPGSIILHQDDFAPPDDQIPIHPVHNIADWDDPTGAIDWPRLREAIHNAQKSGKLPEGHKTYDYLYAPVEVPVDDQIVSEYKARVNASDDLSDTIFVIVDGFLMFWDEEINSMFEMRIFVREAKETLQRRRQERKGYITAEAFWIDPPGYFDNIVWPAYIKAHEKLFQGGDVETGQLSEQAKLDNILLLEASASSMEGMVQQSAEEVLARFSETKK